MSNKIAFTLFAMIVISIALDQYFEWGALVFLGKKFLVLIDFIVFWH